MAEQSGESQKPLEPDLIITREDGRAVVSRIEKGRVLPPYERGSVSETTDEEGGLHIKVNTGRIFRGENRNRKA